MPRMPIENLDSGHIRLMAALRSGPMEIADLSRRLGASEQQVCHLLAALHAAGAVSVNPPTVPEASIAVPATALRPAGQGHAVQLTA